MQTPADAELAEKFLESRREGAFRWGTKCLRGGKWTYNPCVLDRTGWEDFYLSLPYDYDVRNDPVWDLSRSTYHRLGDLGFSWPEPTTKEALRTGYCGPDRNSLTRPAFLRSQENDYRPEPAFRNHLTDRTSLHHLRADPLEGVLPFGRQGDMANAKSVMHRDYKYRQKCCATRPEERTPTYESRVHRFIKTDLHGEDMVDRVVKFRDENLIDDFKKQELLKLKLAYNWPINPITFQPLGGRLNYYPEDPCIPNRENIWPMGDKNDIDQKDPLVIPDCRCQLLAHGFKEKGDSNINWQYNASSLDPGCENVCEEISYLCCDNLPSECNLVQVETKGPPQNTSNICPPKPPCPNISKTPC